MEYFSLFVLRVRIAEMRYDIDWLWWDHTLISCFLRQPISYVLLVYYIYVHISTYTVCTWETWGNWPNLIEPFSRQFILCAFTDFLFRTSKSYPFPFIGWEKYMWKLKLFSSHNLAIFELKGDFSAARVYVYVKLNLSRMAGFFLANCNAFSSYFL